MKKIVSLLVLTVLSFSCEKKTEDTMTVSGTIDGLKKGTLYLQHIKDSTLTTIDSLTLRGDGFFSFSHEIEAPEIFYLYLKKADNNDLNDRIAFFGEQGDILVKTKWNTFDSQPKISGSKSHETYAQCAEMLSKFNARALELGQASMHPEIQNDSLAIDSIVRSINKNMVSRYRYVLNFALTNADSYVAPYMALTEAAEANPKYLDSINRALTPKVARSKYGKALDSYVRSLKQ